MTEYLELNGDDWHDHLRHSVLIVSFDKVNGERRDMTCTLDRRYLPIEASLAVWDLNANGWRSFRLDRVINIQEVSYP
jgi:hypothetical protein